MQVKEGDVMSKFMGRFDHPENGLQFYRRVTKKNLLEIVTAYDMHINGKSIDKIRIGFREYNNNQNSGSKVTGKIDFFFDIQDFDLLCTNILSGNVYGRVKRRQNPENIYFYKGGTERSTGRIISKMMVISPSNKGVFLSVYTGPGRKNSTGAIMPLYKVNNAEHKISIAMDTEELKKFAIQGKRALDFYYDYYFKRI